MPIRGWVFRKWSCERFWRKPGSAEWRAGLWTARSRLRRLRRYLRSDPDYPKVEELFLARRHIQFVKTKMTKTARILLLCMVPACQLFAQSLFAQSLDNTGNGLLNGSYYFRHVLYGISNQPDASGYVGDISGRNRRIRRHQLRRERKLHHKARWFRTPAPAGRVPTAFSATRYLYDFGQRLRFHHESRRTGDNIFGLVSANGVFIGSSTEASTAYNDMFIAALIPTPSPGNSFFNGSYTAAAFFPGRQPV